MVANRSPGLISAYAKADKKQRRRLFYICEGRYEEVTMIQIEETSTMFGIHSKEIEDHCEQARRFNQR